MRNLQALKQIHHRAVKHLGQQTVLTVQLEKCRRYSS